MFLEVLGWVVGAALFLIGGAVFLGGRSCRQLCKAEALMMQKDGLFEGEPRIGDLSRVCVKTARKRARIKKRVVPANSPFFIFPAFCVSNFTIYLNLHLFLICIEYLNMAEKAKKIKTDPVKNNDKFAVIETGGKQYLVKPNMKIRVEKLPLSGDNIEFDKVLLVSKAGDVKIGTPYLSGVKITAGRLPDVRGKKIKIVRYKSKTRRARRKGHRQTYSEVIISDF